MTRLASIGLAFCLLLASSACGEGATVSPAPTPTSPTTTSSSTVPTSTDQTVEPTTTTPIPTPFTKTGGIQYSDTNQLDVYTPSEPGSWPVVVVVHGLGQRKESFAGLAETLASEGAVVFNIQVTFSVPPLDGIEGIACAIRFARAKAPEYRGDPNSITLVGNSSGAAKGSIVAMDGDAYQGDCVVTHGSALPDALVGYEGPYDYATHLYGNFNVPQLREQDPAVWEAVNPYLHIGGNKDLVVRLIHGRDQDTRRFDVLPGVSADFQAVLAEAGYDVELTYVDGASHGSLHPGTEVFALTVEQVFDVIGHTASSIGP